MARPENPYYWLIPECAAHYRCSVSSIRRDIEAGRLKAEKVHRKWLIPIEDHWVKPGK